MAALPPSDPVSNTDLKRLIIVAVGMFALFALLILQYFNVQIAQNERWSRMARRQHFFAIDEPFVRGTFYSNATINRAHPEQPQALVVDIEKYHLWVDPMSIPAQLRPEVVTTLSSLLHLSEEDSIKFVAQLNRRSRNRNLAMWLDDRERDAIVTWWRPFARKHRIARNALYLVSDYQRSYPFGKLLGQVLQTVQNRRDEATGQAIPTGGLEYRFNPYLKGKKGRRRLMRSPRNRFEIGEVVQSPEDGADIHLTINHIIQTITEEELAKGVKKANAKGGWAVMMEPRTGEILALAQYPFFYPACYSQYFNDPEKREDSRIKAATDANEPGSIQKAITTAIGLMANAEMKRRGETPLFDPDAKMSTANGSFPGRSRPIKDFRVYPWLNLDMAFMKSSNIYFGRVIQRVVERLGEEWYRDALHNTFGFGKSTHLELPSESHGLLPTPGKLHPNGKLEWSKPTPYSLAMGHNLQATSLQLVRAFALFANGGRLVEPTLVRKIVKTDRNGHEEILVDNTDPSRAEKFPQVLDPEVIERTIQSMKYVSVGKRSDIPGYTQCGKTGTAEKIIDGTYSKTKNVSSFVGFAPIKDPAFVLIISIDEPERRLIPGSGWTQYGGYCAAPVFREIGRRTLAYLGIAPDDPFGYPVGDPRHDPEKADWVQESKALQKLFREWDKG